MSDFGARVADRVTSLVGSWRFIIIQSIILVAWIVMNCITWVAHWDPYPFILCNLALSFQAAFATPVILMSENRRAAKDRQTAEHDLHTDTVAQQQIEHALVRLSEQDELMMHMLERINELLERKDSRVTRPRSAQEQAQRLSQLRPRAYREDIEQEED